MSTRPATAAPTRERILEAAETLMLTKGFHAAGLNEILSAVSVPKGSFYHYFPSKEQFGVELISHYVDKHSAELRRFFSATGEPALQRFVDYWAFSLGRMRQGGCAQCCLVVKLSLEVPNFSEPMRQVLAEGLRQWRAIFAQAIRDGQADESISAKLQAEDAAAVLQDTWQGALQRMHVEKSVAPLRSAAVFLRGYLAGT